MKLFYEKDGTLDFIKERKVAVFGYGNQGRAHACNLKDSGVPVVVALRKNSKSWEKATSDGHQVMEFKEASKWANFMMILLPDQVQKSVYKESIEKNLDENDTLCFAHGFNIHFQEITPPYFVDVVMVAPKSPGRLVRQTYEEGKGTPCLAAVYKGSPKTWDVVLSYAKAIGGLRAGTFQTTFKDETETDLFGEQTVLCGGVSELVKCGFETLVENGYPQELAYFECLHELKLIVDLFYEGGLTKMNEDVSETAEYGGYTRGSKILPRDWVKNKMNEVLKEVQTGEFAQEYLEDARNGQEDLLKMRSLEKQHGLEKVGKTLRANMSWLKKEEGHHECRV